MLVDTLHSPASLESRKRLFNLGYRSFSEVPCEPCNVDDILNAPRLEVREPDVAVREYLAYLVGSVVRLDCLRMKLGIVHDRTLLQ